jgi:hypothetical protein
VWGRRPCQPAGPGAGEPAGASEDAHVRTRIDRTRLGT